MRLQVLSGALLMLSVFACGPREVRADTPVKKVLLIGQKRDHPPGAHQYMAGLRVLAKCLEQVPDMEVQIVQADEPWPEGPELLRDVDAIVLSLGQGARWIQNDPQRLSAIRRLASGKTGIVAIHWAIGAQDGRYISPHREIIGCIHGGDDRKYVVSENELVVTGKEHPIMTGVRGLKIKDEWYYRLKKAETGKVEPLLDAIIDDQSETVAWAYTREGGGRSFGFSGMHYHENWKNESLRRMIVQAVLWSLQMPVPEQGMLVEVPEETYRLEPGE